MKAILQVSTGVYGKCTVRGLSLLRQRLEHLLGILPVRGVIFGWGQIPGLFACIVETAHRHGAEAYLWMPCFADTDFEGRADPLVPWDRTETKGAATCPGETFRFICPSSEKNLEEILSAWERLSEGCRPDGVFLDRIRYPSAVFSETEFYGCACPKCRSRLNLAPDAVQMLEKRIQRETSLDWAVPVRREGMRYVYADPVLDRLASRKREAVTRAVRTMAAWFHERNLRVGIDTFAPALADLVGQDLGELTEQVDFVKPMMYYATKAPAGVPFELEAYGTAMTQWLSALWGTDVASGDSVTAQLGMFATHPERVYPGIEINQVPGICEVTARGIREAVRQVKAAGCRTLVLSWNVLQARDEDILCAAHCLQDL